MKCDWDPAKAAQNVIDHGITFEEGESALDDPDTVEEADRENADGEARTKVIGFSDRARLLLVVIYETDEMKRPRMISARLATSHERKVYAKENPRR